MGLGLPCASDQAKRAREEECTARRLQALPNPGVQGHDGGSLNMTISEAGCDGQSSRLSLPPWARQGTSVSCRAAWSRKR